MTSTRRTPSNELNVDNQALVLACRLGDQGAWDAIVDRYERLVWAVALGEGLNADQAADVAQECFGALVRSLDDLAEPERVGSWLMTVARRQSWQLRNALAQPHAEITDRDNVADDNTAELAHALWVYEAVERLDDPCRTLVQALFFDPDEPSYSEVAVRLGRPLGSIGPLRARCLERLRSILEAS